MSTLVRGKKATTKLDPEKYVNTETGEILKSEVKDFKLKMSFDEDTEEVVFKSDNYAMIEFEGLSYLNLILSRTELGHTLMLTSILKTSSNIIFNHNIPHTNDTLQNYLKLVSTFSYYNLIKKLDKYNIIVKTKVKVKGKTKTIYLFNPFIARKRSTLSKEILEVFNTPEVLLKNIKIND